MSDEMIEQAGELRYRVMVSASGAGVYDAVDGPKAAWPEVCLCRERDLAVEVATAMNTSQPDSERVAEKCGDCGRGMEMSDGWSPSYGDPCNEGLAPEAEPYCLVCDLQAKNAELAAQNKAFQEQYNESGKIIAGLKAENADLLATANMNGAELDKAQAKNARNNSGNTNSISRYKGVIYQKCGNYTGARSGIAKRWRAYTRIMGKRIWIGYHETDEKAAMAYNAFVYREFGEFACYNRHDSCPVVELMAGSVPTPPTRGPL